MPPLPPNGQAPVVAEGHTNVPVDTGDPAVVCIMLITWRAFADGRITVSPVGLNISGPITPDIMDNLPVTEERMGTALQAAAGQLQEWLNEQAVEQASKLTIAPAGALRDLPPINPN